MTEEKKRDVFISYSTKNKQVADALCHYLEEQKIRCWIAPRDIPPGSEYAAEINGAIKNAQCFIIIFSSDSANSQWCRKETNRAISENKVIIPFRIDKTELKDSDSMEFYLNDRHWIDALPDPQKCFSQIANTINQILNRDVSVSEHVQSQPAPNGKGKRTAILAALCVLVIAVIAGILIFSQQKTTQETRPASEALEGEKDAGVSQSPQSPQSPQKKNVVVVQVNEEKIKELTERCEKLVKEKNFVELEKVAAELQKLDEKKGEEYIILARDGQEKLSENVLALMSEAELKVKKVLALNSAADQGFGAHIDAMNTAFGAGKQAMSLNKYSFAEKQLQIAIKEADWIIANEPYRKKAVTLKEKAFEQQKSAAQYIRNQEGSVEYRQALSAFTEGNKKLDACEFESAEKFFSDALKFFVKAEKLELEKNKQEGLNACKKAKASRSWDLLVKAAEELRKYDEKAAEEFKQAAQLGREEDALNSKINAAQAALDSKLFDDAIRLAEEALKMSPANEKAEVILKSAQQGKLMARLSTAEKVFNSAKMASDWEQVIKYADAVLDISPGNSDATKMKQTAVEQLKPACSIVAVVGGQKVTPLSIRTLKTAVPDGDWPKKLKAGSEYAFVVEYRAEDGTEYSGKIGFTCDWKGVCDQRIELSRVKFDGSAKLAENVILKMVRVEAGKFTMAESVKRQEHLVTLTKPFWIGQTEVTQGQWLAVMGGKTTHLRSGDDYPANSVSWSDVQEFLKKLNEQYAGKLPVGYVFGLPTEAQWEYAARGGHMGKKHVKFAGSDELEDVGWFSENSGEKTHPVAEKKPNELGLYDMSGNVLEWCNDFFMKQYEGDEIDPVGPQKGDIRVLRGGSWYGPDNSCKITSRDAASPYCRLPHIGFRLALVPIE